MQHASHTLWRHRAHQAATTMPRVRQNSAGRHEKTHTVGRAVRRQPHRLQGACCGKRSSKKPGSDLTSSPKCPCCQCSRLQPGSKGASQIVCLALRNLTGLVAAQRLAHACMVHAAAHPALSSAMQNATPLLWCCVRGAQMLWTLKLSDAIRALLVARPCSKNGQTVGLGACDAMVQGAPDQAQFSSSNLLGPSKWSTALSPQTGYPKDHEEALAGN